MLKGYFRFCNFDMLYKGSPKIVFGAFIVCSYYLNLYIKLRREMAVGDKFKSIDTHRMIAI